MPNLSNNTASNDYKLPSTRAYFVKTLAAALCDRCKIIPNAKLTVAVSHGADSTALLAGLTALAKRKHLRYVLTVAHIHHNLRSEADLEAKSVEAIAESLGLPYQQVDIYPAGIPGNLSAVARKMRYEALCKIAENTNSDAVVTGHHGTDQLETLLQALLRGSGIAGLGAMPWRSEVFGTTVIRPLLNQTHADCVNLCESIGWKWSEDQTNCNIEKNRTNIRHQILPLLRDLSPDIDKRIHRTTDQLTELNDIINDSAWSILFRSDLCKNSETGSEIVIDRQALITIPDMILGAGLRLFAIKLGAAPDQLNYQLLHSVLTAIKDGKRHPRRFHWPDGVEVKINSKKVIMECLK